MVLNIVSCYKDRHNILYVNKKTREKYDYFFVQKKT